MSSPPIESFGPELMAALLAGARRTYSVSMPYSRAVRFRQRLYQLRNSMRSHGHEKYSAVALTRITISFPPNTKTQRNAKGLVWPEDRSTPCEVVIAPNDSEFASDLAKAQVGITELPADPLSDLDTSIPDALSDYAPKE